MSNHPNRSRPATGLAASAPTPAAITTARIGAGLTPSESAALISADEAAWLRWEAGERAMSAGAWALFQTKAGLSQPGTAAQTPR